MIVITLPIITRSLVNSFFVPTYVRLCCPLDLGSRLDAFFGRSPASKLLAIDRRYESVFSLR
jgi:hypothetical protein